MHLNFIFPHVQLLNAFHWWVHLILAFCCACEPCFFPLCFCFLVFGIQWGLPLTCVLNLCFLFTGCILSLVCLAYISTKLFSLRVQMMLFMLRVLVLLFIMCVERWIATNAVFWPCQRTWGTDSTSFRLGRDDLTLSNYFNSHEVVVFRIDCNSNKFIFGICYSVVPVE